MIQDYKIINCLWNELSVQSTLCLEFNNLKTQWLVQFRHSAEPSSSSNVRRSLFSSASLPDLLNLVQPI